MNIKTLAAALAFAVIAGSALTATTTASQAGYHNHYKHHGYNKHHGYKSYYGHSGYYKPRCFHKKVKVWDYYGWHWERVRVCR